MKTKFEIKAIHSPNLKQSSESASEDLKNVLAGYRILDKKSDIHSWDFNGRDGSHGYYSFPFNSVKELERKG